MDSGRLNCGGIKDSTHGSGGEQGIGIATVALGLVTFMALLHPHPLVLPLLSIILVVAALGLAGVVALRSRGVPGSLVERMHLAGLILFFGFAAAIMGDPDPAVKSLDALR